jgi:hypothetical protein
MAGKRQPLRRDGKGRAGRRLWPAAAGAALVVALAPHAVPSEQTAADRPVQLAQSAFAESPRVVMAATIPAESASQTPLSIRIGPGDAAPKNSFLRVRGLPPMVSLSEGHAIAPGAWVVPLAGLAGLAMNVPAGISGRSELTVSLVGEDGTLLAEARTVLVIQAAAPPPQAAAPLPPPPRKAAEPQRGQPRLQAPAMSPAERESAEKLVARGERDLEQGNIALARQFFLRAAQAGLARGALLLAATYDPRELARMRAVGVQANLEEARKWYEQARRLGAPEAEERLARLGSGG